MLYLNDQEVPVTTFPDQTSQIWNLPEDLLLSKYHTIRWAFSHEGEFLRLAQLKSLLDKYNYSITLKIDYLPYGRQDKEVSNNTTFALHSFASLLNSLMFDDVIIRDPHSDVALKLIKNSRAEYPISTVDIVFEKTNSDLICYPDAGARVKYTSLYNYTWIYGDKLRDQATGKILKYQLKGAPPVGQNVLIVDDLCDAGGTFILLAEQLYKAGAKEVNLFVTHGLFTKGLKVITDSGIKRVFVADGEVSEYHNSIVYRRL